MSANTTPDNITYPTSGDQVAPLETVFSTMATSVQNALTARFATKQINSYKWANAAARTAQTGMTEGDIGDQLDTDVTYRYSGTAWVANSAAVRSIIGEADRLKSATAYVLGTTMADVPGASVTVTTPASRIRVTAVGSVANANSGAIQLANFQLLYDGAVIGEVLGTQSVPLVSGFSAGTMFEVIAKHTPTAGSHTYKLQASAGNVSAVAANQINLIVETY